MKLADKKLFLSNIGLFFTAREKPLINFEDRLFPIKNLEPKAEQKLEPKLELELETEKFSDEIVNKKNIYK